MIGSILWISISRQNIMEVLIFFNITYLQFLIQVLPGKNRFWLYFNHELSITKLNKALISINLIKNRTSLIRTESELNRAQRFDSTLLLNPTQTRESHCCYGCCNHSFTQDLLVGVNSCQLITRLHCCSSASYCIGSEHLSWTWPL